MKNMELVTPDDGTRRAGLRPSNWWPAERASQSPVVAGLLTEPRALTEGLPV